MEAKLVVISGAARSSEFKLKLPAIIGRSRTVDLPVGHPLISRQHCELFADGEVLKIRDLGSLNGTFVRETRIAEDTVLEPGDEFTVGPLVFKAVYGYMPATASAGDDEHDLSSPAAEESAEGVDHGSPPQFEDEEPAVGLGTVEVGDVPAPENHSADANGGGEFDWMSEAPAASGPKQPAPIGEDDFSLADSTDEGLDTDFDSVVFIPQPAMPRGAKAPADKKAPADTATAGKSAADQVPPGKPSAGKAEKAKAEKGKPAPEKAKSAKAKAAKDRPAEVAAAPETANGVNEIAAESEANDFAPPPHQHGKPHGDPDIDNLLDFLQ